MKSILISIKPEWCEHIANHRKVFEIRKSRPKVDNVFKCYIYCTNDKKLFLDSDCNNKFWTEKNYGGSHYYNGKVVGEFVCDYIEEHTIYSLTEQFGHINRKRRLLELSCLSWEELTKYIGTYRSDKCYAWHISNLKIYDKPKELSEFGNLCRKDCLRLGKGKSCEFLSTDGTPCNRIIPLTRPPQSWCYVESLGG